MNEQLHNLQHDVKGRVAPGANDALVPLCNALRMARTPRIHTDKAPIRLHFIAEWADHRSLDRAAIIEATGADKSTVSRWFGGQLPTDKHLIALAGLFEIEVVQLFRDPHDDWMVDFFKDRGIEELKRIQATLEAAFPKKVAKDATG